MKSHPVDIKNLLSGKLRAGINLYTGIRLEKGQDLESHIAATLASLRKTCQAGPPPGYSHSRKLYRAFGIDPTRHRPSSEALWRRFRESGELPRLHPLVDLTNLLSLAFQVCYGLYDLNKITGASITITLGDETDGYQGIRKEQLRFGGKIVLKDGAGAFGNPSSDSLRTSVDPETTNVLQVIFFHPDDRNWELIQSETVRTCRMFFSCLDVQAWTV